MGVTPAHQEADQRTLLTLALSSSDRLLLEHMYRTMLELGLDDELLELGGSALERFLATAGGADAPAESALTSQQVSEPCGSRWHPKSTVPLNERERERERCAWNVLGCFRLLSLHMRVCFEHVPLCSFDSCGVGAAGQAACLGLLVRAYQRTGQHARAAAVLLRLAEQRPAGGSAPVDLDTRVHLLDQVRTQAHTQY